MTKNAIKMDIGVAKIIRYLYAGAFVPWSLYIVVGNEVRSGETQFRA